MINHTNVVRLRAVASALVELNERVVFVGGATVSLYATDPAAPEPRPTDDVDVVVELANYAEYGQIENRLRQLGFANDVESGVICRYKIQGLIVDIMPTDSSVLGFSNRWYKDGVVESISHLVSEHQRIRIFPAPYFIATKLEAFNSFRHGRDPRMNSDFEDIIYVFDNRNELANEINRSAEFLRSYLQLEFAKLYTLPTIEETIYSHLERSTASQRTQRISAIWREMIRS